jgi:hypothetical protein
MRSPMNSSPRAADQKGAEVSGFEISTERILEDMDGLQVLTMTGGHETCLQK